MKLSIVAGATSQSINIFIQDSSSTTGAGLTGLAYNSSGLTAYYTFAGANATATAITLATLAAVTSAYSSGGFKEIDSTNMPGWYRLDIPNACLATAKGRSVSIHLKGATNMAPLPIEIELTGWDNQSTTNGGLSNLDATISSRLASASISLSSGNVTVGTNNDKTGYSLTQSFPTNFASMAITAGGAVTAGTVSDKTGYSISGTKTTLDALNDVTSGSIWDVTLASHLTAGTTGNALNAAGSAGDPWSTALPGSYGAGTAGKILGTNLDTTVSSRLASGSYTAPDNTSITAIKAKTDNLPASPAAVGSAMTLTSGERTSVADALLDRDMSLGADTGSSTVRTVRQALRFLRNKFALATGTLTVYKEDDTTSSWTAAVTTDATANPIIASDPAG